MKKAGNKLCGKQALIYFYVYNTWWTLVFVDWLTDWKWESQEGGTSDASLQQNETGSSF